MSPKALVAMERMASNLAFAPMPSTCAAAPDGAPAIVQDARCAVDTQAGADRDHHARHDLTDGRAGGFLVVPGESVGIREEGALILIRILGSHFLWKMVRRMVGVLAEVGRGALDESDVAHFLSGPSEAVAPLTAPPSGLFLERVLYEGDPRPGPVRAVLSL